MSCVTWVPAWSTCLQSWTKSWRQIHEIHEIKQDRLFYDIFCWWFFAIFLPKTSKFGFRVDDWVLTMKSKRFRDFIEISQFPKILSFKSFGNSLSGDYNLVPFHLWWKEIMLKSEKIYKYFVQDCTCPRADVPKSCQILIFTCQRYNKRANMLKAC